MTAPLDEARLRELAEALTFFGRYADETREATATRRNNNANDASKAILALLDALSAERALSQRWHDAHSIAHDQATENGQRLSAERSDHMEYRTTADLLVACLKSDLQAERERADDYREALIQADLKIRSFPGADQSDVVFIRDALAAQKAGAS